MLSKIPVALRILIAVVIVAALGAAGVALTHKKASAVNAKALSVTAAPAGVIGASAPNANGQIWLLVNTAGHANVQLMNDKDPKAILTFPVSASATAVASDFGPTIAVAQAAGTTGAVVFYSTVNLQALATTALAGPVLGVVAGASSDYYALVRVHGDASVSVIDSSHHVTESIALPAGVVSIAVSPDGSTIYALQDSGTVSVVDVASDRVTQSFATSAGARQIVLSPDATTLYELKGPATADNVGVISVATKAQSYVLPAPASTVAVEVWPSGASLDDVVGTAQYGNVQVFATAR